MTNDVSKAEKKRLAAKLFNANYALDSFTKAAEERKLRDEKLNEQDARNGRR